MFGLLGYSTRVARALYDIGITGAPPNRIDQVTKTIACDTGKKNGSTPEETAITLYSSHSEVSKYSVSEVSSIVEEWIIQNKVRSSVWNDLQEFMRDWEC